MKTYQLGFIAPSNIALVKYWGKRANQYPCNPSISFSLRNSTTKTIAEYSRKMNQGVSLDFSFYQKVDSGFSEKINQYFEKVSKETSVINNYHFKISSQNTFPHSAGIASSASSMASLALILATIEEENNSKKLVNQIEFQKRAAYLARIGSGSATRSIYGGFVSWGKNSFLAESSDDFGISIDSIIHNDFKRIADAILIVDTKVKKISSSRGHELMNTHPYREIRFKEAFYNYQTCLDALKLGDWKALAFVIEREAMSLHALMMMSNPPFILLHPNSLKIINLITEFRDKTKLPITYTIDAGPNIHLLYDRQYKQNVIDFIQNELKTFLEDGRFIDDEIGEGPIRL